MAITNYETDEAVKSRLAYTSTGKANTKRLRGGDRTAAFLSGRNKYGKKTTGSSLAAAGTWTGIGVAAGIAAFFTGGVGGALIVGGAAALAGGTSYGAHKKTEKALKGTETHKEIAQENSAAQGVKTGVTVGVTAATVGASLAAAGAGATSATTTGAAIQGGTAPVVTTTGTAGSQGLAVGGTQASGFSSTVASTTTGTAGGSLTTAGTVGATGDITPFMFCKY